MENRERILDDASMIEVLHDGGMAIASKRLLFQVVEDYRLEKDQIFQIGIRYLMEILLPYVKGRGKKGISKEIEIQLFLDVIEITWMQWLSSFPGSSVESFEDRQSGRPILWGRAVVDSDYFIAKKAGLFYSVNGFHDEPRQGKSRKRDKKNIRSLNGFYIDLDKAPTQELKQIHRKTIAESPILPSFVVETCNGFHVIWRLERGYDENDINAWSEIQDAIIAHFRSDRACCDPTRLLRMPSSWHCKEMWKGGDAFWVKLVFQSDRVYRMEDFAQFRPVQKKKVFELKEFTPSGELIAPKVRVLQVGERHGALVEETGRIYARLGADSTKAKEARNIIKDWYRQSCSPLKDEWEQEVDACCDWVETEQFGTKI